jgi:asparagine synthase (glutamine-hydrolysing)
MCGILGIYRPDGLSPTDAELRKLIRILDHRGPDDSDVKTLHGAGFGHTRLSILGLDEPLSHQPVHADNCLLTFNGEIYNFQELRQRLLDEGVLCSNKSDTETLFHSLRRWGVKKTLKRLDGMFAFAFYDGSTRTLYLARDRMGEKPLYWSLAGKSLFFASETKAILATGEIRPSPNLARIDDFFHTGMVNGSQTMYQNVRELPPGTFLTISQEQLEPVITPFWSLEDDAPELSSQSFDAWGNDFLERFDRAIESRCISDVPIGILLSGGIDSTSIAARIIETGGNPPPFFFAESADPATSEREDVNSFLDYQRAKQPSLPIELLTATPDLSAFLKEHIRLTWHFDEPLVFTNSIALSAVCRKARDQKIKVLLSGEGSDEILYGYDRFTRTAKMLSGITDTDTIFQSVYMGGGEHNAELVVQLCAGHADGERQTEPWQWLERYGKDLPLSKLQLLFSQKFRLQSLLQRQDRVGMAHGIECRIPFLDPSLVSWMNSLPYAVKYDEKSARTKYLLRHAMADSLPERILTKAKDGFPSGIETWIRQGRLKSFIEDLVHHSDGFLNTYLDGGLAKKILSDFYAGQTQYEVLVWRFFNLEIWHRIFGDGIPPKSGDEAYQKVSRSFTASNLEFT